MDKKSLNVGLFLTLNIPLAWFISLRYLSHAEVENAVDLVYLVSICLGHMSLLVVLASLPVYIFSFLPRRLFAWLLVVYASFGQLFLIVDTYIYTLFRFHFSSFILDLIINGGSDVFTFSIVMWVIAIGAVIGMVMLQILILKLATKITIGWRMYTLFYSIVLVAFVGQNVYHAWEDAHYRSTVQAFTPHFPLHMPLVASRFLERHGFIDSQLARDEANFQIQSKHKALNYPLSPVKCTKVEKQKNILLIAIDALRYDMLTKDLMPNTVKFINKIGAQHSSEHFSGGNSTQAGVFSLFYGLPVTYWNSFSASKVPPVLLSTLKDNGYDIEVFTSATLLAPDFASNVFAGLDKLRLFTEGNYVWEQDEAITKRFKSWIGNRDLDKPFFAFMFYNAVHSYSIPPNFPKIEPYLENVNHLALDNDYNPVPYFNRFKTSARYVDMLLSDVYAQLEQLDLIKNSVIIITADHGESFNEQKKNYWGHGSSYAKEQVQVPFVIYIPDHHKQLSQNRTFHGDLPVTLMEEVLGCKAQKFAYSHGFNVFEPFDRDWVFNGSYVGFAVMLDQYFVDISPVGTHTIYDYNLTKQKDKKIPPTVAAEVLDLLSRYYRK